MHWLVGYPTGGQGDIAARLLCQRLSEQLGQPFIVENRPGGAGQVAVEELVRAPADGYTLLGIGPPTVTNPPLDPQTKINLALGLVPVASLYRVPNVMVVNPSFPAKSVPEFIAYSKANPGRVKFASGGLWTSLHTSGELFRLMSRIDMLHVPFLGAGPALTELLANRVQVIFAPMPAAIAYIRNGGLRALAVTTATRSEVLPDVPAVAEFLPGFENGTWQGLVAPRKTPRRIVDKLNREINVALADPAVKAQFSDLGATITGGSAADFGKFIATETATWATRASAAG